MPAPPEDRAKPRRRVQCRLDTGDPGPARLRLAGHWRLDRLTRLEVDLATLDLAPLQGGTAPVTLDTSRLSSVDTAGALLLLTSLRDAGLDPARLDLTGADRRHGRVIALVRERVPELDRTPPAARPGALARLGMATENLSHLLRGHLGMLGLVLVETARLFRAPRRFRHREFAAQLMQTGVTALPVITLVVFLIGVIVAYLLGLQAEQYGANIFVVDGVALGMVREFSPLLVAVIVAGRSGAAFTAQLGTMKLTEEIDAIRTLGLSAEQVLLLPRVLALALALPLLTFVGNLAGLGGAMLVCDLMLDITPTTFLDRMHATLGLSHVLIGLGKAPVFALVVAVIGCRMGMAVQRDTRSIGINTTSTVVQSIVAVILIGAVFAVFFQELGL
jgi:phospholipid/cholesterol/gamma-HCH transport system permease protein